MSQNNEFLKYIQVISDIPKDDLRSFLLVELHLDPPKKAFQIQLQMMNRERGKGVDFIAKKSRNTYFVPRLKYSFGTSEFVVSFLWTFQIGNLQHGSVRTVKIFHNKVFFQEVFLWI